MAIFGFLNCVISPTISAFTKRCFQERLGKKQSTHHVIDNLNGKTLKKAYGMCYV